MMYDIKSEAQRVALSHQMRRMTVQMKVFHCIKIRLLNKTGGAKFCIHKKKKFWEVFHSVEPRNNKGKINK